MKKVALLLIIVIPFSCETNWGNYDGYRLDYESALEYFIVLDKGKTIYASDSEEEQIKKGVQVKYVRNSGKIDSVLLGKGSIVIQSFVDKNKIEYDSNYIIVGQKPISEICECVDSCLSKKYGSRHNLPTYSLCEEAIKKTTTSQYWIIEKESNTIFGPLTASSLKKKREELGIPPRLTFI
ncbi:hypothetical protein HNQ92_001766 [Rhabdobacter roseus]|uniref:DUF3997 domain-containing protein n=1 Tax=Rhabdobacter roseus TaxID=1655419 RepID=A0A840TUH8_9BACT|nr:hypothetical protein [Rhabdobacter roseus]MBB5283640.1 hypothetical protein [Rhabdobacter roseus]